jgi:phage terminase large subunit-like protein
MQVFAADDRTGDGAIFTLAVLEEAHRHPSLRLYRTWHGKMDKRGGQILSISTAGEPGGEYETTKGEFIARATDLEREGRHTVARGPGFVLHRHALDLADDIHDLKLVKQANPFEGITLKSLKSKHDSPARLDAHWARFTCGVAVRLAGSAISAAEWDQLERGVIPEGEPVWVGADFGWKWDTTAITPLWLPTPERWVFGKPAVIVPPRDGTSTSSRAIKAAFEAIHRRNPIHTVVMDENAGGAQMAEWIRDELDAQVVAYGQTDKPQALAFDRFTEGVREGSIEHPHDETFTLHVLNAIARGCLGDRYKFDKPRNRSTVHTGYDLQVIDALSAASAVLAAATGTETSESFDIEDMRMVTL